MFHMEKRSRNTLTIIVIIIIIQVDLGNPEQLFLSLQ